MTTPTPKDDLLTLATILEEETELLHGPLPKDHPTGTPDAVRMAALFQHVHARHPKRAGLCFSGGESAAPRSGSASCRRSHGYSC